MGDYQEASWIWSQERSLVSPYRDNISGGILPTDLIQQARKEEIDFMLDWVVCEEVSVDECWRAIGKRPLGSGWVDVNKGDTDTPNVRCRFVATKIAYCNDDDFFAAMPPLEALRTLISHVPTDRQPGQQGRKVVVGPPARDTDLGHLR